MANALIGRDNVHAWSEAMAEHPEDHQTALVRLLKDQRRLTRWIAENGENMHPATGGIANYMIGVVTRIYDLAGGKLRAATWEQVRDAERRIGALVPGLLPMDDGFAARARAVGRAQAHILDEALMALFETPVPEGEAEPEPTELLKIYLMMWVATDVLDQNWTPPRDFRGPTEYTYHHIEPKPPAPKDA